LGRRQNVGQATKPGYLVSDKKNCYFLKARYQLFILLLSGLTASAQPWMDAPFLKLKRSSDPTAPANFYDIQKAFTRYEKKQIRSGEFRDDITTVKDEGRFPGYAQYKRWEWHMEQRVYPSGEITLPSTTQREYEKYLSSSNHTANRSTVPPANWTALGPTGTVTNGDFSGAARVNFLRFDPTNSNKMWVVSPLGGLWKSLDGGLNWTNSNTDQLPIIGCSDIAIDPSNTQVMYMATGDANGVGSQLTVASIGIYKSTDGGATWPSSSNTMNWEVSWGRNIYKLLIHPTHPDTVYAATSYGIYRTINAGTNWVKMNDGQFTDIEFKPGHPNTIYAAAGIHTGGSIYRSTDAGMTFTQLTDGLPASNTVARFEIGVTPADSNYVYVVIVKQGTSDFHGFYRSVDGGDHFTLRANTPNILFGAAGNQAWYNLCMAVSPLHKDTIIVGATNMWRSKDGGLTWTQHSSENGGVVPYVHPDHHSLTFIPGTDGSYYSGNDGGLFKTTDYGATWTPMNEGMQIAQMYKFGVSPLDPYTILTGHQDMYTQMYDGTDWIIFCRNTGDGTECIYEHDNDSIRYLGSVKGRIIVSYNNYPLYNVVCNYGGSGVNANGSWITPFVMHPDHDSTLLVGKAQVWRTTNGGLNFTQMGNVTGGNTYVIALAYANSNPNYIYAAKSNRVFISTDGTTFTDKTGALPIGSASITSIIVSNTNPEKAWVTFSGYSAANKIWYTVDAGNTWTNYSTGLPNLPVNCITLQHCSDDGLYVGTDVGVYFRDNSHSSWQSYFSGLPNVDVQELEIAYSIGKIRAATNGRGLWESDVAVPVPTVLTWVGSVSADWNNPANWNPPGVPTSLQDVIIPDVIAPNHDPIVNVPGLACKDLTLHPGANMTVPEGNQFKTRGN